jgi:hypothetical protein
MFAYLADITERIGFATGVLVLPQRQTALVATHRPACLVTLGGSGWLRLPLARRHGVSRGVKPCVDAANNVPH